MITGATTASEACGAADDGVRPLVDVGGGAGSHAASAINAATAMDRTALLERRGVVSAMNEDPSTVALPLCWIWRFAGTRTRAGGG